MGWDIGVLLLPLIGFVGTSAMTFSPHILIVDDNADVRMLIREVLSRMTSLIDECGNGQDAVERLRENRYDLVLTDICMPYLDGYGVLDYIRRMSLSTRPGVIVISGNISSGEETHLLHLGAARVLTKPLSIARLVAVCQETLVKS